MAQFYFTLRHMANCAEPKTGNDGGGDDSSNGGSSNNVKYEEEMSHSNKLNQKNKKTFLLQNYANHLVKMVDVNDTDGRWSSLIRFTFALHISYNLNSKIIRATLFYGYQWLNSDFVVCGIPYLIRYNTITVQCMRVYCILL